jgi:isoamylase
MNPHVDVHPGEPWPLGPHACHDGTNFAVFSRHAAQIELWVFENAGARAPTFRIPLDPSRYRTGDIWHVRVRADLDGRCYVFRATGPTSAEARHRFDPQQLLLDPYAPLVAEWAEPDAQSADVPPTGAFKRAFAGVIAGQHFDWQGVSAPRQTWTDTIIYETHVRGLTAHASSGVQHRGQYLGVIEKIPYLRSLGVTALELLPVQTFAAHGMRDHNGNQRSWVDYWGYNPIALYAPHPAYASCERVDSPLTEFKTMVRELHRAGIEVILDVVFNHTGEAGRDGPVYSFRGLDNAIYYLLTPDGSGYLDYTGCGNTLNCNHPVVRSMIVDCLRHWVVHLHVDGFRFDLAAVLGRGADGALLANPPVLEQIAEDPILRNVKLIAEAWDSAGAFEVGRFAGARWGEWNCHFRDDVRRFWRSDPGLTGAFASRLCGSADLYQHDGQTPVKSINFITSHDGFTLHDLVSYAVKHNAPNGEDNRDGMNQNYSANYGVEGPALEPATIELRVRQLKNLLATLLLARGVPMLLGGDEFARSQSGNNNAYCQDNEISWYDWRLTEGYAGLVRFVQRLITFRRSHAMLRVERFYAAEEIEWLGAFGRSPEWQGPANRIGCVVRGDAAVLALLFNATTEPCEFTLPSSLRGVWRVCIDTARAPPADAPDEHSAPELPDIAAVQVAAHSTLVASIAMRPNEPS